MLNSNNLKKPRVLLEVSASIAAFKAVALCSKLVQADFDIEVILSPDAAYFVGSASFEGLTGKKVHQNNFEEGSMMAHIKLERWADLILLYPASANTLAQLANGTSQSLIGSVFLAHEFKKPYWLVPAMNQAMIAHPATQGNLTKLRDWGMEVLESDSGALACGEVGAGRLIEPEIMLEKINTYFSAHAEWKNNEAPAPLGRAQRILITSGGTTEPIDSVRSIHNFSTGQTGFALAQVLSARGHEVTLMQSRHSAFQSMSPPVLLYDTTQDFAGKLHQKLESESFDVLIHAAAVADYAVESVTTLEGKPIAHTAKIQGSEKLLLTLTPNPKILKSVRDWSQNKSMKLISFKLTSGEGSDLKLENYDSDLIVHNELAQVAGQKHSGVIYMKETPSSQFESKFTFSSKLELAQHLSQWIELQKSQKETQA